MVLNFIWAFGYNVLAIPVAAGNVGRSTVGNDMVPGKGLADPVCVDTASM